MSKPVKLPRDTAEHMQKLLKQAKTAAETKRVQCVLLGAHGISSLKITMIVGWKPEYIRRVWKRYREEGESFLLGEKRGRARGRAFCSLAEEKEFLTPFFKKAAKGGVLIVSEIKEAYEKKLKRKIHHPRIYEMLHRQGWRKIVPRPYHPKRNLEAQEEFRASFPPQAKRGSWKS